MYGMVRTQNNCHGKVATEIFGTKGRAYEGWIDGEKKWRYEGQNPGGHQQEQNEFMAALRSGKVINNGTYMARSTLISILGQLACYTGKRVTWEQICASSFSYPPKNDEIHFGMEPPVKPDSSGIYPVPVPGKTDWI